MGIDDQIEIDGEYIDHMYDNVIEYEEYQVESNQGAGGEGIGQGVDVGL